MGDKYCEQAKILSSFFPPTCLEGMQQSEGQEEGGIKNQEQNCLMGHFFLC